jgi:DNA-binding CsgD family transcriptional regulator
VAVPRIGNAAAGFERLGMPYHEARARLACASLQAGTDTGAATDGARRAFAVFDRLGAPLDLQQARKLLRDLGATPSRGRAKRDTGTPFSPRELEVARLVAAGHTNAEVATQLFVSPRTVTTHLDRIYSRLGLSSRVALTRYLADGGWLEDPSTRGRTADT